MQWSLLLSLGFVFCQLQFSAVFFDAVNGLEDFRPFQETGMMPFEKQQFLPVADSLPLFFSIFVSFRRFGFYDLGSGGGNRRNLFLASTR